MDSGNILSIMSTLAGSPPGGDSSGGDAPAPATNVMQAAAPPPASAYQDPTAQVAQAATAASPPMPKPRRSLLDTIGKISDVLATVGGAQALYQPSLDAATARQTAASDHDLAVRKANLDYETSKFDLSDKQQEHANNERERFASVLGAVNDADDAANLPAMMAAAGLTDARYKPFVDMIQKDPDQAKVLASALGGDDGSDMGKTIKTGYDAQGNRVSYIVDGEGNPHILNGVTPDASYKVVNTGDKTSLIGPDGKPKLIIPNKVSPNTAATTAQSNTNNIRTTNTQLTIAGMPARPKAGTAASPSATAQDALSALDNIQGGFDRLHGMGALAGDPNTAAGTIEGAFGRTALGQKIGAQMGNPAAQERLALQKNLSNLQSYMISSLPGSATRTRFEQEIQKQRLPDPMQMDYATASRVINELRTSYKRALAGAQAETKSAPRTGVPAGWENAPTLSPADAAKLPSGAKFRSLDGRPMTRQ